MFAPFLMVQIIIFGWLVGCLDQCIIHGELAQTKKKEELRNNQK
jgi:hypothetical protein